MINANTTANSAMAMISSLVYAAIRNPRTEVRHQFAAEHHADQQGEAERWQDLTGDDQSIGYHRRNGLQEPAYRRRTKQNGKKYR
ncbi:Uncharacterised protein [Klebsiella pneumoniae]|uniref:Uncharacterized protein n=1 Tax=Klebsiella pneumoniae TaxID=573 RepID=A0A447S2I5_KLEPN|nr:Uncharacterised protein [Klebsiella pneumoniae]